MKVTKISSIEKKYSTELTQTTKHTRQKITFRYFNVVTRTTCTLRQTHSHKVPKDDMPSENTQSTIPAHDDAV